MFNLRNNVIVLVFTLSILSTSCSSITPEYNLVRNTTKIYVQEDSKKLDSIRIKDVYIVNGSSIYYPALDLCIITLRKYPICLAHEVRHCLEGSWHDSRPNSDDCN